MIANKKTMVVSFSGGRTSAFMSKWLKDSVSHIYRIYFVFANTGLEHEKTLEFVNRCDKEWGLNIVWIEDITHMELGKGQTYRVVNYETASRNGEPYKNLASIEGVPCPTRPICTDRLKTVILKKYRDSISKNAVSAIGIRADEMDRINPSAKKERIVYPLVSMRPTYKPEIINWFKDNSFDLEIPEHLGNCVTCWKKSDRKLLTIAKNNPEHFIHFKEIESKYGNILSKEEGAVDGCERKIFRKHRAVDDILKESEADFVEWTEIQYAEQLDLLGFDQHDGCEDSCEPFSLQEDAA